MDRAPDECPKVIASIRRTNKGGQVGTARLVGDSCCSEFIGAQVAVLHFEIVECTMRIDTRPGRVERSSLEMELTCNVLATIEKNDSCCLELWN